MKPSALLAAVVGILLPISSFAQLKIVGQNAEAPDSKINYLEHPVSFEQFFPNYSRENNQYGVMYLREKPVTIKTVWPRNEQVYVCTRSNEGFRIINSSVKVGLPVGYYNISGCILCKEEFQDIENSLRAYLDTYGVDWEIKRDYTARNWACPSYKTLQETINTTKDPKLWITLYILKNKKGEEYYVWPHFFEYEQDRYIMVDFYNYIQEQFKNQDFVFFNEGDDEFVLDAFKNVKVPIQSSISDEYLGGHFSEFNTVYKSLTKGKKYHCSDVLVNNNNIVLVVKDGNDNSFSFALYKSRKMSYSDAYVLKDQYTVYLNAVKAIQGRDAYHDLYVISPKELEKTAKEYARIKAGQTSDMARQNEQRRKDIIQRYGNTFGETILNHKLALGMSPEMCIASIGYPSRRYKNTSEQGVIEVFYYAYMVVHFSDGELVRIEQVQ